MTDDASIQGGEDRWHDQVWRLHNLYFIVNKWGRKQKFEPNWAQQKLLDDMWYLNVVLKARQLGFTTFIDLLLLDNCIWQPNKRAGIICHALPEAAVIFRDKVKFPFDNLPEAIREACAPKQDSANELLFANNSSIRVGTSMRSGTFNYLHISEYGKLCARTPDKAREVKTGALNTVQAGQMVFIESTAEGRAGHFFELCQRSQKDLEAGKALTALDYRFHFFPWWEHPEYTLPAPEGEGELILPVELAEYFVELQAKHGIELDDGRKRWYWKKSLDQGEDMKREYPSTPEEAFFASIEGAYYRKEMTRARVERRIRRVPFLPNYPVNTFWDLGFSDYTSIWFHQQVGLEHRFVKYYENSGEALSHYAKYVLDQPWIQGKHFLPHDAYQHSKDGTTSYDSLRKSGLKNLVVVDKVAENRDGVNAVREILSQCLFDEIECERGIAALEAFRKKFNEREGVYQEDYVHDWASHGAKAFEQFARSFEANPARGLVSESSRRPRGWRSRRNRSNYMTV
jgi:hypothetical protein